MWSFMKRVVGATDAWILAKYQHFLYWTQQPPMRMALNCAFALAVVAVCRLFAGDSPFSERIVFSVTTLITALVLGWGTVLLSRLGTDLSDLGANWRIFWGILLILSFVVGLFIQQPWRSSGSVCLFSLIYFASCRKPPPRKRKEDKKATQAPLFGTLTSNQGSA